MVETLLFPKANTANCKPNMNTMTSGLLSIVPHTTTIIPVHHLKEKFLEYFRPPQVPLGLGCRLGGVDTVWSRVALIGEDSDKCVCVVNTFLSI